MDSTALSHSDCTSKVQTSASRCCWHGSKHEPCKLCAALLIGTPRGDRTPRSRAAGGVGASSADTVPLERQLRRGLTALARAVALEALGLSASVAGGAQAVLQVRAAKNDEVSGFCCRVGSTWSVCIGCHWRAGVLQVRAVVLRLILSLTASRGCSLHVMRHRAFCKWGRSQAVPTLKAA